ncbi:MAG TPA: GtrA family protein [Thermomicrobiales bacterium]|jgi:dolichol-phosphate mannosyltransferase
MESIRPEGWRANAGYRLIAPLLSLIPPEIARFIRFGLVGGSGVVINMLALYLLHDEFGFPLSRSSLIAISLAILNNFLWNNFWTFRATGIQTRRVIQFVAVSLVGMVINLAVLNLLFAAGIHYAPANLAGIMVATAWNFYANSRWTWGEGQLA